MSDNNHPSDPRYTHAPDCDLGEDCSCGVSEREAEEQTEVNLEDLVGHMIQLNRPTFITRDCSCGAKNRLARADHSPMCAYSHETVGFIGVLWAIKRVALTPDGRMVLEGRSIPEPFSRDDLTEAVQLETTEGLGWTFEQDRDTVTLMEDVELTAPAPRIASLEMIERAATELVLARKALVKRMESVKDEGSGAFDMQDVIEHADVERAGRRAEAAINRLVELLDLG